MLVQVVKRTFYSKVMFSVSKFEGEMSYGVYEDGWEEISTNAYGKTFVIDTTYSGDDAIKHIVNSEEYKNFLSEYKIHSREDKLKRILDYGVKQ